jgi:beta-xylosidase
MKPFLRPLVMATALGLAVPLLSAPSATAATAENLVLRYALDETSGTVATDSSGKGRNGTIVGGASTGGAAGLTLDGADDAVKLPDNILAELNSITVSTEVLIRQDQPTPYFVYGLGTPASSNSGNGYLATLGDGVYRTAITPTYWNGEQSTNAPSALSRGVWKTLTYTLDDASNTARLYLDGTQVAQNTNVTVTPAAIGGGVTTSNYIGRSNYASDRHLAGSVRDFRIYDTALTAAEVTALQPSDTARVSRDASALSLGNLNAVTANLTLPTTGANGSTITWSSSAPQIIAADGKVTRPLAAAGNASVTLTATLTRGSAQQTKTFAATVLANADDQAVVNAAAAALSIPNADDVRGNITVPGAAAGTSIAWTSSDPAVVSTAGVVTRQSTDRAVTLRVTVTKNAATATREIVLTVRKAVQLAPLEGYAFAYFTGNSVAGENIFFAASKGNNALAWDELNGGQPKLTSTFGEKGLRDPFLIRSPEGDTFYLIATDLSIGRDGSWDRSQRQGSRYLEVWESHDLVNWSEQRHVLVSPETAGNTWAPEAHWDETIGAYVVYWASKLYAENDPGHTANVSNVMMYATTRDFTTFSTPQVWQDQSRIDSTVLEQNGTYHRFTKDEGASGTGCSDIIQEKSTQLRAPLSSWSTVDACIGRDAGTSAVEGPTAFAANPGDVNGQKNYLFVDEYGGRGYIPLQTTDLNAPDWKVAPNYDLPASPRHGTVLPVTAAELAALRAGVSTGPTPVDANADGEILRYSFDNGSGGVVKDVSGNGRDGTIAGGAAWQSGSLSFDGVDDSVKLPDNVLAGVEDVTVEAEAWIDPNQGTPYFLYGLGNSAGGAGNGYLFSTGDAYRTSIATGNWTTEQTANSGSNLTRGRWAKLTYTLTDGTATIYLDGAKVGTKTGVTVTPGDIGDGTTTANNLGRSVYSGDKLFKGQYREFALWNRALSESEVLTRSGSTDQIAGVSLADPEALKVAPIVENATKTVTFPVKRGTDRSALAPTFTTAAGVTSSPASGTVRDLRTPVTYTLTQPGGTTATWIMKAIEMKSPIIPGLYADPNIAVFGDTYYVYATTDGTPGWGGRDFYVWSSKNLIDWTRSEKPFLTLDNANGNVPWAAGNAWAPTIIEKNGKYYFYFSGHNDALNRKVIGVAVADSPTGPFTAQPDPMITNGESVSSGQAIDPAAFTDPATGKSYLFWGNGSPLYAELSDDMLSIKAGTTKPISGLVDFREGLFVNFRQGLYHLTYSIDDTGSENYKVGYATSTSIDGPWTYRGVVLEKDPSLGILATGHNSIVNVPGTDDWYIAYHRFAIPGGDGTHRETTIDRVNFDPATGLMRKVIPTLESVGAQTIVDTKPLSVTITGATTVGSRLTATASAPWTATAYQWKRGGTAIAGATGSTYTLTAADRGATISVSVTATKPQWASSTATAQVGPITDAQQAIAVKATASTRCVQGKVVLSVVATNPNSFPVKVVITSAYGSKTVTEVAAGKSATHSFTTREASVPAGQASATASAFVGGKAASASATTPYAAATCG